MWFSTHRKKNRERKVVGDHFVLCETNISIKFLTQTKLSQYKLYFLWSIWDWLCWNCGKTYKTSLKMAFYNSSRPKTLMEILLAKKIEAASAEGGSGRRLFRTDSMDSMSSMGSCTSSMLGEDVCRCDDCLLGIVDLYIIQPNERASLKKKVTACIR